MFIGQYHIYKQPTKSKKSSPSTRSNTNSSSASQNKESIPLTRSKTKSSNAGEKKEFTLHNISTHSASFIKTKYNIKKIYFFMINIRPIIGIEIDSIIYLNIHMLAATQNREFLKKILNILIKHLNNQKLNYFIIGDFNIDINRPSIPKYFSQNNIFYVIPKIYTHKKNQTKIDYMVGNIDLTDWNNSNITNLTEKIDHIAQLFYIDDSNKQFGGKYYKKYIKYKLKCKYSKFY
jgi:hypothetical protein